MFRALLSDFPLDDFSVEEKPDSFQITFSLSDEFDSHRVFFDSLTEIFGKISHRDTLCFNVIVDDDQNVVFSTNREDTISGFIEQVVSYIDVDSYASCELQITKKLDKGFLSIYDSCAFMSWLENASLEGVFDGLEQYFYEYLVFESFDNNGFLKTNTMCFVAAGEGKPFDVSSIPNREWKLEVFKDNCFSDISPRCFLPDDFRVLYCQNYAGIENCFNIISNYLSLIFFANKSALSEGEVSYTLKGYRVTTGSYRYCEKSSAGDLLYKVYSWAYSESGVDKLGLARNVVGMYTDDVNDIGDKAELWEAILSNYQVYLKGNIETYLEIKSRVSSVLTDLTSKSYSLVEGFLDSLRNSIYILVTFLISVVLVNGLKDMDIEGIFSKGYMLVIVIICVVFLAWIWFARWEAIKRFKSSGEIMKSIISQSYGDVLTEVEIKSSVEKVVDDNERYLKAHSRKSSIVFSLIVVLFFALYSVGFYLVQDDMDLNKSEVIGFLRKDGMDSSTSEESFNYLKSKAILENALTDKSGQNLSYD